MVELYEYETTFERFKFERGRQVDKEEVTVRFVSEKPLEHLYEPEETEAFVELAWGALWLTEPKEGEKGWTSWLGGWEFREVKG